MSKRFLSILLLLLTAGVFLYSQPLPTFNSDLPAEDLAEALMEEMDNSDILGQVLMLGYMGETASDTILHWIRDHKVGGIKVFGWNANDLDILSQTITEMQKTAVESSLEIPLFIATDQEGGWVRHVKGETSITPGNLAIGASGLPYDAYMTGYLIGMELKALGINMNFAPTVDVYLNPLADVIGPRAFSHDPVQTGILGLAFLKGQDEAGVISTAKHYPGHGNAEEDSHGTLPVIQSTKTFLENNDLIPYKMMIQEGLPAVMVGHLAYPQISGDMTPASLSSLFLRDILRTEMGYKGLIITDDLVMQGAHAGDLSLPEVCEESLRAGSDILLVSRNPENHEKIWDHLTVLMNEDEEFRKIVEQACRQVLLKKIEYLKREDRVPLFPAEIEPSLPIPAEGGESFFFSQAVRSTTLLRNERIPIGDSSSVLIAGMFSQYRSQGLEFFPQAETMRIPYSFDTEEKWQVINELLRRAESFETVIFSLSRYQDLRILKELSALQDKLIVLSSLTPVYINETPWVRDAVAVYGTGWESFAAGFGAIRGDFTPTGHLPIPLEE